MTIEINTIVGIMITAPTEEGLKDAIQGAAQYFPHKYTLPCGESVTFDSYMRVSLYDVPCPCGDPTHWFVKTKIDPTLDKRIIPCKHWGNRETCEICNPKGYEIWRKG